MIKRIEGQWVGDEAEKFPTYCYRLMVCPPLNPKDIWGLRDKETRYLKGVDLTAPVPIKTQSAVDYLLTYEFTPGSRQVKASLFLKANPAAYAQQDLLVYQMGIPLDYLMQDSTAVQDHILCQVFRQTQ